MILCFLIYWKFEQYLHRSSSAICSWWMKCENKMLISGDHQHNDATFCFMMSLNCDIKLWVWMKAVGHRKRPEQSHVLKLWFESLDEEENLSSHPIMLAPDSGPWSRRCPSLLVKEGELSSSLSKVHVKLVQALSWRGTVQKPDQDRHWTVQP